MSTDFTNLERLSKRINEASDELNKTIKEFTQRLADLRIGLEVSTPLPDVKGFSQYHLWYIKERGKWTLLIGTSPDTADGAEDLLQAPRVLRMAAMKVFQNLIKVLEAEVEKKIDEVESVRQSLE